VRDFFIGPHLTAGLSSVLNSEQAIQVNIEIIKTFVKLRRILTEHVELSRKLNALERRYDSQFKMVFDAIRELMTPPVKASRRIGFKGERRQIKHHFARKDLPALGVHQTHFGKFAEFFLWHEHCHITLLSFWPHVRLGAMFSRLSLS
jgi:hypothetical protein